MANLPEVNPNNQDPAVNLIRTRIDALYGDEPIAKKQAEEPIITTKTTSKHQIFIDKLHKSGKSLAQIQTEWYEYYQSLPDNERYEVWQEFYKANEQPQTGTAQPEAKKTSTNQQAQSPNNDKPPNKTTAKVHKIARPTIADAKNKIRSSVSTKGKGRLSTKAHFKSLLFGLCMGSLVVLVLLFSFFNERFVAPFITPSKNVSSIPIILDPSSTQAGPENLIIIPKINVEVPVVYDVPTIQEKDIQTGLERGVVHYASTPNPGEKGNSVVVGHSSNNILNSGKYKFAFVLLNKLEVGDTLSMTKNSVRYTYKIYDKKIVSPSDVSVLGANDKPATITLITCDPPGTSINRLIIVAEQITPEPTTNLASTAKPISEEPSIVPGNAPSLWSRFSNWLF